MDESILEYRSRLSEVESQATFNSQKLENMSQDSGGIFTSNNASSNNAGAFSAWSILWTILNLIFLLLFFACLIFIWCLFKRPDILIKMGMPVMAENSFAANANLEQFQEEEEESGDLPEPIETVSEQANSLVPEENSYESNTVENTQDGYAHFFNEGNAYSTPDASLLDAKKHLGIEEEETDSTAKIDPQKYARPTESDSNDDSGIDFEGSLQTIVLDLDKMDSKNEPELEKVFSEKDKQVELSNSNKLDHLQDDLETFDFMEEDIDDIDLSDDFMSSEAEVGMSSTTSDFERDLMGLQGSSSNSNYSSSTPVEPINSDNSIEFEGDSSSEKDDIYIDPSQLEPVDETDSLHNFDVDPEKVNPTAIADELADFSLATQPHEDKNEPTKEIRLEVQGSDHEDSLENDNTDPNQDDLFANIAMFELLDDQDEDAFQFDAESAAQLENSEFDIPVNSAIQLQEKTAKDETDRNEIESKVDISPRINADIDKLSEEPLVLDQVNDTEESSSDTGLSTFEKVSPMDVLTLIDSKVKSGKSPLCLFYFDIDNFERFESKFGILPAETLSQSILQEIWDQVTPNNPLMLNRFRQKSFVLISRHIEESDALSYAQFLVDDLQAKPIEIESETHFVSISAAVIPINEMFESGSSAVASAQSLVSQIQNSLDDEQKSNVRLHKPNFNEALSDDAQAAIGRRLLNSDSFNVVYRPIIGLKTESTTYLFESRLELDRELMDAEYPVDLLDRLYNSDLAIELDKYLLSSCCIQLDIRSRDHHQAKVLLNFSIQTLTKSDFIDWFSDIISSFKINPSLFVIQVDELSASRQMIKLSELRRKLSEIKVQMSMSHLCFDHIPIKTIELLKLDYAKLHHMLIQQVQNTGNRRSDLEANDLAQESLDEIVQSAKQISSSVIVPGVEQAKLLPKLWKMDVSFIEGDYVAPESSNMQPPKSFLSNKND